MFFTFESAHVGIFRGYSSPTSQIMIPDSGIIGWEASKQSLQVPPLFSPQATLGSLSSPIFFFAPLYLGACSQARAVCDKKRKWTSDIANKHHMLSFEKMTVIKEKKKNFCGGKSFPSF